MGWGEPGQKSEKCLPRGSGFGCDGVVTEEEEGVVSFQGSSCFIFILQIIKMCSVSFFHFR